MEAVEFVMNIFENELDLKTFQEYSRKLFISKKAVDILRQL